MRIPATLVRGGTSKCWLFRQVHVPSRRSELERLLVGVYGAADPVQLDGVGGATPTTSKAAVVGVSSHQGVDIDYLFAQVGIGTETVEWGSNCGNCATGVALYAVAKGLVPITGDLTRVAMRNVNTGAILEAVVDTAGGVVHEFGVQTVPGTRSGGVAVGLTFLEPAGRSTGALLSTGAVAEPMEIAERSGTLRVSMVDAGAPVVLVDAVSAGRTGAEPLERVNADIPWIRGARRAAASRMGLSKPGQDAGDAVPKAGLVGPPLPYTSTLGEHIAAEDYDISVRMLSMNTPHPAIGLTSAVAVATTNLIDGSVVFAASAAPGRSSLRVGTPAGVVRVTCTDSASNGPGRVTVQRAARLLCDATILVPDPRPAAA